MGTDSHSSTTPSDSAGHPPRAPSDLLGLTLLGRYRLEALLGKGGAGAVFLARHVTLGTTVAVKVLDPAIAQGPFRERFFREARMAASLAHPGIVAVIDLATTEEGAPFLVMEHLEGLSLSALAKGQPLPWPQAAWLVRDALDALAAAHDAGIIHRDLKPANLYLARKGPRVVVKLLDFGIAKVETSDAQRLTNTGQIMGTPGYMSPEQLLDFKRVDQRADLYSMGAVLFYLLIGESPLGRGKSGQLLYRLFKGETRRHPRLLQPEIPEWLDSLVASSLSEVPDERPASARAFLQALEQGLRAEGQPVEQAFQSLASRLPSLPPPTAALPIDEQPTVQKGAAGPVPPTEDVLASLLHEEASSTGLSLASSHSGTWDLTGQAEAFPEAATGRMLEGGSLDRQSRPASDQEGPSSTPLDPASGLLNPSRDVPAPRLSSAPAELALERPWLKWAVAVGILVLALMLWWAFGRGA